MADEKSRGAGRMAGEDRAGAPVPNSQEVVEEFFDTLAEAMRRDHRDYVPLVKEDPSLPRAEEYGVVGSWPVPAHRPKL